MEICPSRGAEEENHTFKDTEPANGGQSAKGRHNIEYLCGMRQEEADAFTVSILHARYFPILHFVHCMYQANPMAQTLRVTSRGS